jgi:hypothetical protein
VTVFTRHNHRFTDARARGYPRFDLAQFDPESSDFGISIYASGVRDFCLNAYLSQSQEFK